MRQIKANLSSRASYLHLVNVLRCRLHEVPAHPRVVSAQVQLLLRQVGGNVLLHMRGLLRVRVRWRMLRVRRVRVRGLCALRGLDGLRGGRGLLRVVRGLGGGGLRGGGGDVGLGCGRWSGNRGELLDGLGLRLANHLRLDGRRL